MAVSAEFAAFIMELMEPLQGVTPRRMFGGVGLFRDGVMFGLIAGDRLYLKSGAGNRPDFEAAGCRPFSYETSKGARGILSYHEVPEALLDEPDDMAEWARKALDEAVRAASTKRVKSGKS